MGFDIRSSRGLSWVIRQMIQLNECTSRVAVAVFRRPFLFGSNCPGMVDGVRNQWAMNPEVTESNIGLAILSGAATIRDRITRPPPNFAQVLRIV